MAPQSMPGRDSLMLGSSSLCCSWDTGVTGSQEDFPADHFFLSPFFLSVCSPSTQRNYALLTFIHTHASSEIFLRAVAHVLLSNSHSLSRTESSPPTSSTGKQQKQQQEAREQRAQHPLHPFSLRDSQTEGLQPHQQSSDGLRERLSLLSYHHPDDDRIVSE